MGIATAELLERRVINTNKNKETNNVIDGIAALLLALCPILQHYRGIFGLDASELILCILFPYLLLQLFSKRHLAVKILALPALYFLYISFSHGFHMIIFLREALLMVYFVGALNGVKFIKLVIKMARIVAVFAAVLICIQYVCYYLLHFHLQLVPTDLLVDSAEQWVLLAKTGTISVTGKQMAFYRPSSIFLEPSHMALYFTPSLLLTLLQSELTRKERSIAVLLSIGVLFSTSGIGIGVMVGTWLLYGGFYAGNRDAKHKFKLKEIFKIKHLIYLGGFAAIALVMFFTVDVFRNSVVRIFSSSTGSVSAIDGRVSTGIKSLSHLTGIKLLIGRGTEVSLVDWNMAGFFYTLYKHGLIGVALTYIFYLQCLKKSKREYFWLILVFIVCSFFTVHTYAAFYRMFYISMMLVGVKQRVSQNVSGIKVSFL